MCEILHLLPEGWDLHIIIKDLPVKPILLHTPNQEAPRKGMALSSARCTVELGFLRRIGRIRRQCELYDTMQQDETQVPGSEWWE